MSIKICDIFPMVYLLAPPPGSCGDRSGHICGNGVVHYTASEAAICGDRCCCCWADLYHTFVAANVSLHPTQLIH